MSCAPVLPKIRPPPRLVWQRCCICSSAKCYPSSSYFPHQELESPSYPSQGLESSNFLLKKLRRFQIQISKYSCFKYGEIEAPGWGATCSGCGTQVSWLWNTGSLFLAPLQLPVLSPSLPPLNVSAGRNPSVWLWVHFSFWNSSGR